MAKPKHPPGPMTLGTMVTSACSGLVAYCLNDACRHQALIDVWSYLAETEVPWFLSRVKCPKCDCRPHWLLFPIGPHVDLVPAAAGR
jgi:hypothetical protein